MTFAGNIKVSVALVTRNRPESLVRCLASWRAQNVQPFEIVISDDSDGRFQMQNRKIAERFQVQWMAGPRRGLYANRNHIVKACRGSHIRSADDDHELPPNHFASCLAAVDSDPAAVWIIGEHFAPVAKNVKLPPPCPGQLHPRGFSEPPIDTQNTWALADGASIFPRSVFDLGFRYAECFKFGDAYLEFGSLLHARGFRIRQLEATYVIHHFNKSTRSFLSREIDLKSELFAILCHSFIYQPTARNWVLTTLTCVRQAGSNGRVGVRAIKESLAAFRARRLEVKGLPNLPASSPGETINSSRPKSLNAYYAKHAKHAKQGFDRLCQTERPTTNR